jgi:hypothetical protein
MHNNGYVDINRTNKKELYTVVEAAVLLARAEGAKNASDPRINKYTQLLLQALESGNLSAAKSNHSSAISKKNPSLSTTLTFNDLKNWLSTYFENVKPDFLFKN